jgi:hypothetical protein
MGPISQKRSDALGSERVTRAGKGVLAIADLPERGKICRRVDYTSKGCCGEMPQPTRETRALPKATVASILQPMLDGLGQSVRIVGA